MTSQSTPCPGEELPRDASLDQRKAACKSCQSDCSDRKMEYVGSKKIGVLAFIGAFALMTLILYIVRTAFFPS